LAEDVVVLEIGGLRLSPGLELDVLVIGAENE
jgi:hypothetical protein